MKGRIYLACRNHTIERSVPQCFCIFPLIVQVTVSANILRFVANICDKMAGLSWLDVSSAAFAHHHSHGCDTFRESERHDMRYTVEGSANTNFQWLKISKHGIMIGPVIGNLWTSPMILGREQCLTSINLLVSYYKLGKGTPYWWIDFSTSRGYWATYQTILENANERQRNSAASSDWSYRYREIWTWVCYFSDL